MGDEWKTKERQLQTLLKSLSTYVDNLEDVDAFDVVTLDKKRLEALLNVCGSYAKLDQRGSEFASTYEEVSEAHDPV